MDALLLELAKAGIWILAGVLGCSIVTMWRRERAEKARDDARVEAEFGSTLARWRSASDAARHLRPSWLPAATRSVWVRVGSAVRDAGVRVRADVAVFLARFWPTVAAPVVSTAPPVWSPVDAVDRDANTFVWPTNPVASGRAAVDVPAELDLDFAERIRVENALLHRSAELRLVDPDATGLIPTQSGGVR